MCFSRTPPRRANRTHCRRVPPTQVTGRVGNRPFPSWIRHELPPEDRQCPACGGALTEMTGQTERSERITTVKLTSQVEDQVRQEYRCAWMPENIWGTVSVQP